MIFMVLAERLIILPVSEQEDVIILLSRIVLFCFLACGLTKEYGTSLLKFWTERILLSFFAQGELSLSLASNVLVLYNDSTMVGHLKPLSLATISVRTHSLKAAQAGGIMASFSELWSWLGCAAASPTELISESVYLILTNCSNSSA